MIIKGRVQIQIFDDLVYLIAILFLLETGCRPNEAAFIILKNSIVKTGEVPGCDYIAGLPTQASKTRGLYKWGVKRRLNHWVKLVKALHERAPTLEHLRDQHHFAKMLFGWFKKRILKDAAIEDPVVRAELKQQPRHNLRSVRSFHAELVMAAKKKADAEGEEEPANTLQHVTFKTTEKRYVPAPKGTTFKEQWEEELKFEAAQKDGR